MDRHCYNNNQYTAYTYPHWHILCAQRSQMLSIFFLSAMLILLPKLFIEFNHHIVDIPFFLHCFPTLFFLHCWHPIFATEVDHGAYPTLHQQKPSAKPEKPRLIQTLKTFTHLATLFVQIIDVLNLIWICLFFPKCSIGVSLYCVLLAFNSSTVSVVWVWQELVDVWSRTPLRTKPLITTKANLNVKTSRDQYANK